MDQTTGTVGLYTVFRLSPDYALEDRIRIYRVRFYSTVRKHTEMLKYFLNILPAVLLTNCMFLYVGLFYKLL